MQNKLSFRRILVLWAMMSILFMGCHLRSNNNTTTKDAELAGSDSIASMPAQKLSDAEIVRYKHQISNVFDSLLLKKNFNGAVLIAKQGNVLYEQYIGYKNPQTKKDTIDANTAFHLASTSKPFTGMAVLRLVQQGKLQLQDAFTQYFPSFPYPDVTVQHLLSHRSGLPNYLYFMEDKQRWNPQQMVSNQDVLNFLVQYHPPANYKAGTRFNYCNTNYVLLALLIEKVTSTPYPQYLQQTIFTPLHMNHTFVYTPAHNGSAIMSYKPSGQVWQNDIFENTYGDKNIYSTPGDLLKWNNALYNTHFIRKSLLDTAYQPFSLEKPSIHNYGLGWRMLNLPNGKQVIYHFGKWHGFTPAFARLIDEQAVVIVLGNQYNRNIYEAAKRSYDIFGDYMQHQYATEQEDEALSRSSSAPSSTSATKAPKAIVAKPAIAKKAMPPNNAKQKVAHASVLQNSQKQKAVQQPVTKAKPATLKNKHIAPSKKKAASSGKK